MESQHNPPPRRLARPRTGRAVSGLCALAARLTGLPVGPLRVAAVLLALGGATLAVLFAIFDHALYGGPAPEGLRVGMVALGALLVLAYPLLAVLVPDERRGAWDFGSSSGSVLLLVLAGQAVGTLLAPYWDAARGEWMRAGTKGWFTWVGTYSEAHGFGAKEVVLVLFFLSTGAFLWLQREAVKRFLRSMHTGVSLVALVTIAVCAGVLVPQIDGFEDPDQRVDLARERQDYLLFRERGYQKLPAALTDGHEQYQAFRWAEGYFLYHLVHPYGIGLPKGDIAPAVEAGLERFGDRYGPEEASNRRKAMASALSGQQKIDEIGAFVHRNEDELWRFFEVSTLLQLNRTYKSNWFAALLIVLFFAVFANTYKGSSRTWFKVQKLGWFTVHHGILILLIGGGVSKLFTDRGILQLFLGDPPQSEYWRHFDPGKRARLPFAVRLDHFGRKDWPALRVHFMDERFSSQPPAYTLWEGRAIDLDYATNEEGRLQPRLRIDVKQLHDRTRVGPPLVREASADDSPVEPLPLAEVRITTPDRHPHDDGDLHDDHSGHDHGGVARHLLVPILPPAMTAYFGSDFRLAAAVDPGAEALFPAERDVLGMLEVEVAGAGSAEPLVVPAKVGTIVEAPGGYALRVVDATADFDARRGDGRSGSRHPLPLEEQPDRNPAVWIEIDGRSEDVAMERRIVFDRFTAREQGWQSSYPNSGVVVRFHWDSWSAPGPPRYLLAWTPGGGAARLVSEGGTATRAAVGEPLALPGDAEVELLGLYERAEFEKNLEFLPPTMRADRWDADFYAREPDGVVLDIVHFPGTPHEVTETVAMAATESGQSNLFLSEDRGFALEFFENTQMLPFEWRSVLSIVERDNSGRPYEVPLGPESRREIRVNDYFHYRGFRFFQTNADPQRPDYSGVGVVYDPGIPIVLVGMYTIIAGTVIAFLVRPIVLARRRSA